MDKARFIKLIDNYVTGTLTKQEWEEFQEALEHPEYLTYLDEELLLTFMNNSYDFEESDAVKAEVTSKILEKIKRLNEENHLAEQPMVVSKRSFIRSWQWAAAVLIILLGSGVSIWLTQDKQEKVKAVAYQKLDVPPGKNGAILKLADGREMILDSIGEGVVAVQSGIKVKLENGQLVYEENAKPGGEAMFNTMTTPKGRQFQLILSDGTKVWLNAASSITYPASFSGKSRKVKISGEAYFEVARMEQMPFTVQINNKAEVKVLGTHFNINSYEDEGTIKTTLLEGSVEASVLQGMNVAQTIVLKPGQQSEVQSNGNLKLNDSANIEEVMAWKNGLFNFENADLEKLMRQLSRWYDIEVVYEKGIPKMSFGGEMSRNVSLAGLLSGLERAGVHFRMEEGRRLVVVP